MPIDLIVMAEDVESYKPAHGHWERFFELTTADASRHVHVAASLFHDIAPGARARADDGLDQPARRGGRAGARPGAARPRRAAGHARRARPGVTLRPPREDEFDAMLELMHAHQLAAFGEADVTADELRSWLTAPSVDVERGHRVLEREGGWSATPTSTRRETSRRSGGATSRSRPTPTRTTSCRRSSPGWRSARKRAGSASGPRRRTAGHGRLRRARLHACPALVPDGDRARRRALASRAGPTASPSHERRGGAPAGLRGGHRGLARHVGSAGRDVRRVGALDDRDPDVRSDALVPRVRGRRARGLLALPRGLDRPQRRLRRHARRPAAVAAQGLGEALLLHSFAEFRGGATRAPRSASTRRARPARRGSTSGPACASTATPCSSSARCRRSRRRCRACAPAAPTAAR